jgi:putative flippase GtrA
MKNDWRPILIIGGGIGLLIQPILANNLPPSINLSLGLRVAIFFSFLIFAPLCLFIARLIARSIPVLYQFAQFAAVGTLNTFIDLGVFNIETALYGTIAISNSLFAVFKAVSFVCATTNSFLWNKYWTFGSKDKANAGQVTSFYGIALVGWALNVGTATLVKSVGPVSHLWINIVAPLSGVATSFLWNFLGYKYWVFKRPESAKN